MRIFLTGGTGVIGKAVTPKLLEAGHQVTALCRSPQKAKWLRRLGATPVECSLFDPAGLRTVVAGHDVVVNLATHIPPPRRASKPEAWSENERIRTEGSANLIDAALVGGVRRVVQESLAFAYADHADAWVPPGAPVEDDGVGTALRVAEGNAARFGEAGGIAVVLRFGRFYGADSDFARMQVRMARAGLSFEMGAAEGFQPLIAVEDAASAVLAALDAPAGTYDIVDNGPLRRREIDDAYAEAVGRRRLRRVGDAMMARRESGRLFQRSMRVSNAAFVRASGWAPRTPDTRVGIMRLVGELGGGAPRLPTALRVVLWVLALSALAVGIQAQFSPQYFYDEFPFGRGWVAMDPPFNEHLVRDVGGLQLALAVVTFAALISRRPAVVRAAGLATVVDALPHALYHTGHLDGFTGVDTPLVLTGTWLPVALGLLVAVMPIDARLPGRGSDVRPADAAAPEPPGAHLS